jgi:predicted metal-binding protein
MEHLNCKISDMQDLCRKVLVKAREDDVDIFVMCTGPCNYCEVCSFKKGIDCPHPEMSIPSVSGYGIPVRDMLKEIGHESKHDDKRIELFGLILY